MLFRRNFLKNTETSIKSLLVYSESLFQQKDLTVTVHDGSSYFIVLCKYVAMLRISSEMSSVRDH